MHSAREERRNILFGILTLVLIGEPLFGQSPVWQDREALGEVLQSRGFEGCFVVQNLGNQELWGWNSKRAQTQFIPASTFKIANSIIGLTVGAVKDVDEVLPYGGQSQPVKVWEQDMSLRDAIKVSNVPVYRGLARRIGEKDMQAMLKVLEYGNQDIGDQLDLFWLAGPLKISPMEQLGFLTRLIREELPVPKEVQRVVKDILFLDQGPGWKLFAKTGWTTAPTPGIGWWVGWLEKGTEIYVFALNVDIVNAEQAQERVPLGKACLGAVGLLE